MLLRKAQSRCRSCDCLDYGYQCTCFSALAIVQEQEALGASKAKAQQEESAMKQLRALKWALGGLFGLLFPMKACVQQSSQAARSI